MWSMRRICNSKNTLKIKIFLNTEILKSICRMRNFSKQFRERTDFLNKHA